MTPGEIRARIQTSQMEIRGLESHVERQKSASPLYSPICHELTEAWDSLERALALTDELASRAS